MRNGGPPSGRGDTAGTVLAARAAATPADVVRPEGAGRSGGRSGAGPEGASRTGSGGRGSGAAARGNAGMQYTDALTETPDGFEATFAVNVLAHHLFVRLLQDRFTAPARIVITVSDTHFGDFRHNMGMVPGPVWRSPDVLARTGAFPEPHTAAVGRTAYSTSKLAAVHLVHEYARRLPAGIDAVAYNPGFVPGTGLARNAGPVARFAMRRVLPVLTLTPFATGREAAGRRLADVVLGTLRAPTGSYVDRDRVDRSSEESYDERREGELWEAAERFTAAYTAGTDVVPDGGTVPGAGTSRLAPADRAATGRPGGQR
ncbi:hypothetical protein GCM10010266_62430 [Streptomyces griseomycini]|nr:hypothetical protein GCM10010266_62430 [Streptomyces griseomycini]